MRTISFINYKGGVGKTTSTYHIGCALAYFHKKRVLLVDIDPQTNLTFLCAIEDRWNKYKNSGGQTIFSLYKRYLEGKGTSLSRGIWKSPILDRRGKVCMENLDLIPSDFELITDPDVKVSTAFRISARNPLQSQINAIKLKAEHYVIPRIFLKELLRQCQSDYDYVLIDCPPNLYLLTQNALLASDYYVVTALPDHLSTIGMQALIRGADDLSKQLINYAKIIGHNLSAPEMGGVIFVRVLRQLPTKIHSATISRIQTKYRKLVFSSYTTELTGYQEASQDAIPVFLHGSANAKRASDQYLAITDEFLKRFP